MTPCKLYRHYKNKLYAKMYECITPDTGEPVVVYRALYDKQLTWCRPTSMFSDHLRFIPLHDQIDLEVVRHTPVMHTETGTVYEIVVRDR